jgi:hypothetical protein
MQGFKVNKELLMNEMIKFLAHFPEPLENAENGADNDEKEEKQEKQCNGKMEKKSPIKFILNS